MTEKRADRLSASTSEGASSRSDWIRLGLLLLSMVLSAMLVVPVDYLVRGPVEVPQYSPEAGAVEGQSQPGSGTAESTDAIREKRLLLLVILIALGIYAILVKVTGVGWPEPIKLDQEAWDPSSRRFFRIGRGFVNASAGLLVTMLVLGVFLEWRPPRVVTAALFGLVPMIFLSGTGLLVYVKVKETRQQRERRRANDRTKQDSD